MLLIALRKFVTLISSIRNNYVVTGILACVASVSNRVIARKLEQEQKKKLGGGGEKRKRLPTNPTILENAP